MHFLTGATPLKDRFVEYGLPDDFIEDLQADINDFEQSVTEKSSASGEKVSATASIGDAVKKRTRRLAPPPRHRPEQIPRQPRKTRRVDKCQPHRTRRQEEKAGNTAETVTGELEKKI